MLKSFTPRQPVQTTHYELVFRLEDGSGGAFAFECDERGGVYLGRLPQIARHSLELCLRGEVDGYSVRLGVVHGTERRYVEDSSGTRVCGAHVTLHSSWANACGCGREYNGSGQLLADRASWGEQTSESVADTEHDPDGAWE